MSRFFADIPLTIGEKVELPEVVFHHWVRVLRAELGERATFFNGLGGEYQAELIEINKKNAFAQISDFNPIDRTEPYFVTLGQVMSKGDRMDYAIQKATELGVGEIQLLTSERCEMRLKYDRDQKKIDHWQQVAIAACEQCGLNRVPKILAPLGLADWYKIIEAELKLVLAPIDAPDPIPKQLPKTVALLIGAEGGLSEAEIIEAEENGFLRWQIGPRVLRTETAPVVALARLSICEK
ncbi:16S rRNA (uracil(1498)-N(3))-methyltransferase [Aquirhabdus parva]|uniref:Ribosomal RNA small subunit methyltransferase E n=1 Tax=Aquirhabdus parva TaxID=2283318 RepID=A0A345P6V3_9GAMM|nr:16S rRNA (uracil(1498)-N(3))-methyltransferase [Aquirhabdus parva]AXI03012.1 16S rRNA (uracil(1498)-N(3))-methyltransferase [Aquirhabdus parva]